MNIDKELEQRSGAICELCGSSKALHVFAVAPSNNSAAQSIYACHTCVEQMEDISKMEANHWRCLNDSMWSPVSAVQVVAWRMLNKLKAEGWPQDLLDILYLDEETLSWAKAGNSTDDADDVIVHKDSNGAVLATGDTVVLIKDLDVKGANFIAKRGTAVRNIMLVHDNSEHIEGKVNGQQIVILTKFVKKST
jgi:protein PhnA